MKAGDRVELITGIKGTVVEVNGVLLVEKDWNTIGEPYSPIESVVRKL